MQHAVAPPAWLRVLYWFKGMPDWFKAASLGGAVACLGLVIVLWATDGRAEEVSALKTKVMIQQTQLDRIESKLDHLILKLIPGG